MKFELITLGLLGVASASPAHRHAHVRRGNIFKRQVPQEHSHEIFLTTTREFLNLDNPKGIADPVFGLLGDAAAAKGAGQVTNLACLKQETADQAFTNAKAAGDIRGMSAALVFQAIERNTGSVGGVSAACTETPVNPEIGAFSQHQDAAGPGALEGNKAITLALAKQLALIGGDPLLALESGTFVAGDLNDRTGAGNSCDNADDPVGCIFTQRLLLLDATPDEINAAVQGVTPTFTGTGELKATHVDFAGLPVADATAAVPAATDAAAADPAVTAPAATDAIAQPAANATSAIECPAVKPTPVASASCTVITTTVAATAVSSVLSSLAPAASAVQTATLSGANVQAFTGTLGGAAPPVVSSTGDRPFSVNGNTFTGAGAALGRSCDIQHNACANAANSGKLAGGVGQCDAQNTQCRTSNSLRKRFFRERRQATPAAGDFGTCTDPTVKFAAGLDGRTEEAFIPNNLKDFGHGSAQKIGIIAGFICQRLSDSCKAPAEVQASCAQASAAAVATTQDQAAADAFNGILVGNAAPAATPTADAGAGAVTAAPAATESACLPPAAVVMTITQCA
ncbi:hypothetical protein ACHAQH_007101 [Verticillium albo-atrum]